MTEGEHEPQGDGAERADTAGADSADTGSTGSDEPTPRSFGRDMGELVGAAMLSSVFVVLPLLALNISLDPGPRALLLFSVAVVGASLLLIRLARGGFGGIARWMGNTRAQLAWLILFLAASALGESWSSFEEWRHRRHHDQTLLEAQAEFEAARPSLPDFESVLAWALRNDYRLLASFHSRTGGDDRFMKFIRTEKRRWEKEQFVFFELQPGGEKYEVGFWRASW